MSIILLPPNEIQSQWSHLVVTRSLGAMSIFRLALLANIVSPCIQVYTQAYNGCQSQPIVWSTSSPIFLPIAVDLLINLIDDANHNTSAGPISGLSANTTGNVAVA